MKVLDATFLIDYLDGVEATKAFYEAHGGENERWVMPVPAYAEALVGEGNLPSGDVDGARGALSWGETYAVDERTAVTAGEIADEVGVLHDGSLVAEGPPGDLIGSVESEGDADLEDAFLALTSEQAEAYAAE